MNFKALILKAGTAVVALAVAAMFHACTETNESDGLVQTGKVTGVVTDELAAPIAGVTVTASECEATATTDAQGVYTLTGVSVGTHIINFSKTDYAPVAVTVVASKFDDNLTATVSPVMEYAAAKIRGRIVDAFNAGAPLAGVSVKISDALSTVSAADGTFEIGNLPLAAYEVTLTKSGYSTVVCKVAMSDFVDGIATIPEITMGGNELLPGLTLGKIKNLRAWHFNEYRGGRNADSYPHWDWSCNYMCTLDFFGNWEEQNEGTTVRILNDGDQRNRPFDLREFDSFVAGRKFITSDNAIFTMQLRTHGASADAPAFYGVKVIDLTASEPQSVLVGGVRTIASDGYQCIPVDLSAYAGKEICIAVGIFRQQPRDYWKQLVIRSLFFAKQPVTGFMWLPGTRIAALPGWELSLETVRSIMPHDKKHFTGISPVGGNRDNYVNAYRTWRDVAHIGSEWHFVPLHKDPEVFPGEGYLIKTRSDARVNTKEPESYYYAKFAIAPGCNKMTLRTRNFGGDPTYFKVSAIEDNGTVTHVAPVSNTAQSASAAADGCWKFVHDSGANGRPDSYAAFTYDFSQFNGKNVTVAISIHMGEANGRENKLVLYSIDFE